MKRSLLESHKKLLVRFLEEQQSAFLNEWHETIFIGQIDPHKEKIKENGSTMFSLIKQAIAGSLSEEELKQLAFKVANERLQADINIGDFVFNVNAGRSIIIRNIFHSSIPVQDLHFFIDHINHQFDLFSYHAVTIYTNLKNKELSEKNTYIHENHKDKLALLGQMSSSFVHEFRNPLTSVMGFIKLLRNDYPNFQYLDIINHELNQLNFRITQFLHTSKADFNGTEKEDTSISKLFEDIRELTYPSIVDTDVNVISRMDQDLVISTYRDELKQVMLNLFINSIDALKHKEKPRNLTVNGYIENSQAVISISNNGPAIPSENIKTIFEPFFTTKELGTGIGLFVCKKIVEKHGGSISCESNEHLTTFTIVLPAR
ncbi:GHKL domain-containing protein [Bacillus sp. FJAT-42376]|uniref:histidine kinase N-terminal domain-containing protein n=1 Tax=Bacillus sp. FJAT-42376 TaxID=2014076 RepID=UPI000F4DFE4D|nr:histidine kinase N-terminal domain-containing protein [Bacillus sp. FJAT-42376]AZB41569.1 GHKL domain-containing protein [Bacillus sp. FJAT-42376]